MSLLKIRLIMITALFMPIGASADPHSIDENLCFHGYSKADNRASGYNFSSYIKPCLNEIVGDTGDVGYYLKVLKDKGVTNSKTQTISRKAAEVYYNKANDNICDANFDSKLTVQCTDMGLLARLTPEGRFAPNFCKNLESHSKCLEFMPPIQGYINSSFKTDCDGGFSQKNYCTELVTAILSTNECGPSSDLSTCDSFAKKTLVDDPNHTHCKPMGHEAHSISDCVKVEIRRASVPTDATGGDATTGGDGIAGGDETTGNADADNLKELADRVGNQVFGNLGRLNNYGYQGGNIKSPDSDGGTDIQAQGSGGGGGLGGSGELQGTGIISANTRDGLLPSNPNIPGGPKAEGGGPGGQAGGGPRGGGGAGAFAGGGGGRSGGGRAGKKRRRGRYSSKKEISKKLGRQSFYGATGSPSSSGGGLQSSQLSPKIKKALEQNKAKDLAKRSVGQVNDAFQAGLRTSGQGNSDVFLSPLYFPGVEQGLEYIKSQKDHLDDKGREL